MSERVFVIASHYMGVCLIDELLKTDDEIVGVVAGKVRPISPGRWFVPPEYEMRNKAIENYLPLYEPKPSKLNNPEFLEVIRKTKPDFIVSGYYARIFCDELLAIPPKGCVNFHPAKLPNYRGMTPHFTHMLLGDDRNYTTMHWLNEGVDTGDIIAIDSIEIKPEHTGFETGRLLSEATGELFGKYWPQVKAGTAPRIKQDESQAGEFYFSWDLAEVDWTQSATQIWNVVRTLTRPLGGAWTMAGGHKMYIWKVSVIEPGKEVPAEKSLPGQILAMTGSGMWVRCGEGQIRIHDTTLDEQPDIAPFELLAQYSGSIPILLG